MNYILIKWLEEENCFESRYRTNNSISNTKNIIQDYKKFRKYYSEDTKDLDLDILLSDDLASNNVEIYTEDFKTSKQIKIAPGTNLRHANYLFKKLIDSSENMILDKDTRKSIFSLDMKTDFYKFLKRYS